MPLRLEPRPAASRRMRAATPVIAVGLTVLAGAALFALLGFPPLAALYAFFVAPIDSAYGLSELTIKATPLTLIAIGLSLGFRANVWNIGAEGQLTIGAIAGFGVAMPFGGDEPDWVLPAMLLAGTAGGALWAGIPALLRTRFNASEILSSLMLTYVATLLLGYLVTGPWRDPAGFNFPQSPELGDAAQLPRLIEGMRLHIGWPLALAVVAAAWLLIARGFVGFQIKVIGLSAPAAAYAGFRQPRIVWLTLLAGGSLAGLAGIIEVAGPIGQLLPSVSPGYGFTAIIVAFLGRLHPLGILAAALLVSLSYLGGEAAQISMKLPLAASGVFQGLLLFFLLATDVLVRYRPVWSRPIRVAA